MQYKRATIVQVYSTINYRITNF